MRPLAEVTSPKPTQELSLPSNPCPRGKWDPTPVAQAPNTPWPACSSGLTSMRFPRALGHVPRALLWEAHPAPSTGHCPAIWALSKPTALPPKYPCDLTISPILASHHLLPPEPPCSLLTPRVPESPGDPAHHPHRLTPRLPPDLWEAAAHPFPRPPRYLEASQAALWPLEPLFKSQLLGWGGALGGALV